MNLISNKRKAQVGKTWCAHPRPEGKRLTNSRLRWLVRKELGQA